jgi:hypothetical protein
LENWHSDSFKKVQLTLSQGKKKKGENVADDEEDDAVRNSGSQDQVTATLCTEELFLSPQYIQYSFPLHIRRSTIKKIYNSSLF